MTRLTFTVPGPITGKGRPRFARVGAHVRTFTPGKTASYEATVKHFAHQAMAGAPLIAGPVHMEIAIALVPPGSWPAWKRAAALDGRILPTVKPDADNVLKLVCDALNGIVWGDDVQLVSWSGSKRYAAAPGLTVSVMELPQMTAQDARRVAA